MPSRVGRQGAFLSPDQLTVSYGDARARIARGTGADWFGPLDPMAPVAPQEVASRQWDFPAGFNLTAAPRTYEPITFEKLRGLAETYDLLRLIIETRKDQVARMTWSIRPRKESATNANDPATQKISAFFKRPDGVHGFSDWLRMLLEDLFVIDAPALYIQRDRIGRLLALLPLDGATIKPIIDDWGRTPQPFMEDGALVYPAAFQQALKGLPAVDYSVRDLIYRPRNVRAHSAYGFSPVEQIITSVGIALRRQIFALEYYTSGNIPDSLIGVPETWTPDQIANYQNYWDAYIEGDLGARRKAKFVPGGVAKTFIQTKEPELKSDFDEWLARICCFAFSVSPQALVKQMNRASADTQKELAEEEGLWPVLNWVKSLIDDVIEREFNAPELEFVWDQDAQVDVAQQAEILSTYVKAGVLTINEARQQLGQAPLADPAANRAMTLTATGYQPIGAGAGTQGNAAANGVAKFNVDELRIPQGNTGGGRWTDGSAFDNGVYRPGKDGKPKPTPVQEEEEGRESEFERTPEEIAALAASRAKVQNTLRRMQALDPDWRPPDQIVGLDASGQPIVVDQLANDQAIIAAARAREDELRHQGADFPDEPVLDRSNMENKLKNYALNPDNPNNGGKADWFNRALGFDQSNWKDLADQIYYDSNVATYYGQSATGTPLYQQVIPITGPNGRTVNVRFGFEMFRPNVMRLSTAFPGKK